MTEAGVPFFLVDVFAREPLSGNPLALVPDADGIDEGQMRSIAREFNQSETTFLVRPMIGPALWRLRSFTPAGVEVGGAGHNAMGAWLWLAASARLPTGERAFVQQIGDDLLHVEIQWGDADEPPLVTMDQSEPEFGETLDYRDELATALGLETDDLASDDPQVVSTGVGHLLVPLLDRSAVDRAVPSSARLLSVLRATGGEGCYIYAISPVGGTTAYARFFNPTVGISEDPATGTAAGPLAARLVREGKVAHGAATIIEQGTALGRRSLLQVTVEGERVRLSGGGVVAASGTLHLAR